MSPFDIYFSVLFALMIAHALCDFVLQTDPMAKGKAAKTEPVFGIHWTYWLTAHALVHAGGVLVVTGSVLLAACEFVAHWIIDELKNLGFTNLHRDQMLHLACKCMIAKYAMILGGGTVWWW